MAAVPYKLLPLSEYQELKDGNSSETLTTTTADFHQNKQHQLNRNAENHEKGSQRTIGEIQKKNVQNIKESQSNPSRITESQPTTTGYGTPSVSYLHTDARSLPQFSQQTRLQQSFKNYTDLLELNDIPLHLKIPLLEYYNQRFANSKNEKQGPTSPLSSDEGSEFGDGDDSNNTTHYKFQSEQGASLTIPQITQGKRRDAERILTQLAKFHKHIRWNSQGEIIKPVIGRSSVKDLKSLLEIIIYRNKGNVVQFADVTKILLPILPQIREFIQNRKLLSNMENNTSVQRAITKKLKKKLKKKKKYQALF